MDKMVWNQLSETEGLRGGLLVDESNGLQLNALSLSTVDYY